MAANEDALTKKARLEREYNKNREVLYNKIIAYYRQDISSSYVSEDDIIALVKQCAQIKKQYIKVRDQLMGK
jgi:hypothetical protein